MICQKCGCAIREDAVYCPNFFASFDGELTPEDVINKKKRTRKCVFILMKVASPLCGLLPFVLLYLQVFKDFNPNLPFSIYLFLIMLSFAACLILLGLIKYLPKENLLMEKQIRLYGNTNAIRKEVLEHCNYSDGVISMNDNFIVAVKHQRYAVVALKEITFVTTMMNDKEYEGNAVD